jgi:Uma2 family endonuclease
MSEAAGKLMSVDEFLVWAETREGKWELHDGVPVAMAPERALHSRIKALIASAFLAAIRRERLTCGVYTDGLGVRVGVGRTFIPDLVIVCPPAPEDDLATDTPLLVVEVLSPSTAAFDHGAKLEGYFTLPSLLHYLLIDPDRRVLILHSRGQGHVIETRILHDGPLRLDPPGIDLDVGELFAP